MTRPIQRFTIFFREETPTIYRGVAMRAAASGRSHKGRLRPAYICRQASMKLRTFVTRWLDG